MKKESSTNSETEIKVTKINGNWHSRLFVNGKLHDEMSCELRSDIGWICREMMRWLDKGGAGNEHTSSSRTRHNANHQLNGKVRYYHEIQSSKEKNKAKKNASTGRMNNVYK